MLVSIVDAEVISCVSGVMAWGLFFVIDVVALERLARNVQNMRQFL
jgi:hypothetical protein